MVLVYIIMGMKRTSLLTVALCGQMSGEYGADESVGSGGYQWVGLVS